MGKYVLTLILLLLVVSQVCGAADSKSVLMVIAANKFAEVEFFTPMNTFIGNIYKVTVASDVDFAKGYSQYYRPHLKLSEVNVDVYDAVVIVGGEGIVKYYDNVLLREIVKEADNKGKVVAAICAAPPILARAGLLEGKNATAYPSSENIDELKKYGAEYIEEAVVVDGNIVTGNGPNASDEFGKTIAKVLNKM